MISGETRGLTIWLTGLPSAGKSTIAGRLSATITAKGHRVIVLDGDEVRERLNKGLGFSKEDRDENVRRIACVVRLLTEAGAAVIVAAISPYRDARDAARAEIGRFAEIHVSCPVEECIRRDVKGLYKKTLAGQIEHFTGVSDPYEPPLQPELVVRTEREMPHDSARGIVFFLQSLGYLPAGAAPRLVFEHYREHLPHLKALMEGGCYGPLESTHPPITVPAWACMMRSQDPGQLGIYGFSNRKDHSYDRLTMANASVLNSDALWDLLGRAGKNVIVLGVPPSFPPKP